MERMILVEAGHRCAIPTCRATPVEIAHIDPWAKVLEHKPENLIALCPTCHTRYDRGEIDRQSMLTYKRQLQRLQARSAEKSVAQPSTSSRPTSPPASPSIQTAPVIDADPFPKTNIYFGDYELVWPPHLFVDEATNIIRGSQRIRDNFAAVERLLGEAFRDSNVVQDFNALSNGMLFGVPNSSKITPDEFIQELIARAYDIPIQSSPRAYWKRAQNGTIKALYRDLTKARKDFSALISNFEENGYLDQAFPRDCVDDHARDFVDPAIEIERRLGVSGAWPLNPQTWDEDTFLGLVEVFHDLVSRPREAWYHDFANCGMHYSSFATESGRKLYRWHVNRIFEGANLPYRISESGEYVGRIVG
ncbi:HNH endonuclease signature motif containing protein [Nonomuraea rhodomycinica]|uniref:HNH endonuclease n=1 Tax=Nonomuraea rhodomycinica TaxID=1712872 RepID=A0A7Y6IVR6_9ACTN|nr:HNH endonuclease signature motif containing protein [Nonomuraea rhodomycinica]NUW44976.1 HNH endonuclease [Nonomuraea rhodomycinica]